MFKIILFSFDVKKRFFFYWPEKKLKEKKNFFIKNALNKAKNIVVVVLNLPGIRSIKRILITNIIKIKKKIFYEFIFVQLLRRCEDTDTLHNNYNPHNMCE